MCFALAYLTAEFGYDELHGYFGYIVTALVLFRLCWGCVGSEYARFSSFFFSIREVLEHVMSIARNRAERHIGHTPAGSAMVFSLLALLLLHVSSGLIYQDWGEFEGPLWAMGVSFQDSTGLLAEQLHNLLPEVLLVFVALHILGVIVASWQHWENLPGAMIHGYKLTPKAHEEKLLAARREGESRVSDKRGENQ